MLGTFKLDHTLECWNLDMEEGGRSTIVDKRRLLVNFPISSPPSLMGKLSINVELHKRLSSTTFSKSAME